MGKCVKGPQHWEGCEPRLQVKDGQGAEQQGEASMKTSRPQKDLEGVSRCGWFWVSYLGAHAPPLERVGLRVPESKGVQCQQLCDLRQPCDLCDSCPWVPESRNEQGQQPSDP